MVVSRFGGFKVLILMTNLVQKVIMLKYEMVITDITEFSILFLIDFMPLTTNLNGHTTIISVTRRPPQQFCIRVNIWCHQCIYVNV
jgi:hypothetical protein